ncbi:MAG: response regulator [Bacteroidota bacterium]
MESTHVLDILLVEDNPNDVKLTLRALQKNNLANHVHVVSDGAEALDFLFFRGKYAGRNVNEKLKLILLDLKLPKVDGLDVLKAIKSDERTKTIPVVILTSSKEERDIIEGYNLGVNSYVVKPLDFDQFISSVAELGLYWLIINEPAR